MRRFSWVYTISILLLFSCNAEQAGKSDSESKSSIDLKVDSVLKSLSLEEKVGEMTQLTLDMLCVGEPYKLEEPHRLDTAKLNEVLVDLNVGSILNCGGHAYEKEKWLEFISVIQEYATKKKASGIPVLYGIDAIHGTNYTLNSTLFPQQINLAATWDPTQAVEMGRITAMETRMSGIPWTFSPVLDVARDPRWPRFWETFGEDVYLVTEMGNATVEGYQGNSADSLNIAACLKHYLGYSTTLSGKDRTPAWIPERQLREYFLPPFKAAIDKGARTIMVNSGEINGIPVHINKHILTTILREELGFEGVVLTDWEDIVYLMSRHKVAANYKDAIEMAIEAGIDMSMVPTDIKFPKLLKELVEEGRISEARIDQSVRRILKLKFELDLFNNPVPIAQDPSLFATKESAEKSYYSAAESIVLLKNKDNILPMKETTPVLLSGPTANSLNCLNGGWTGTWQGTDPKYNTEGKSNIKEAFEVHFGASLNYVESPFGKADIAIPTLKKNARAAEAIVLAIGESPYTETPGDIESMDLEKDQLELVKAAAETGLPVIVVLVEGRPRTINEIASLADAIIWAGLPGNEGARALADILTGTVNPSGKLPFTYPRNPSSFTTYDHKYTDRIDPNFGTNAFDPLFEFGHGLSYTTFDYSDLSIEKDTLGRDDMLRLTISVSNTGEIVGKEVVQVYSSDLVASITPSVKRLRAFEKVELQPGEKKNLEIEIPVSRLAFVGKDLDWTVESGEFELTVGTEKRKFYVELD